MPISLLGTTISVLAVRNTLPARNVRELVALARAQRGNLLNNPQVTTKVMDNTLQVLRAQRDRIGSTPGMQPGKPQNNNAGLQTRQQDLCSQLLRASAQTLLLISCGV